jgi:hypothetical protein
MFSPTTHKNNIFIRRVLVERCRRNHLQKSSRPRRCVSRSGWEGAMTSTERDLSTLMTPTCWYCLKFYFQAGFRRISYRFCYPSQKNSY